MVEIGHFALVLALALGLVQMTVPLIGARLRDERMMAVAGPVTLAGFVFTALSFAILTMAYARSDFSLQNVWENSHSLKPMLYKITGVWGNHEGSMLLWVLILTFFGALVAIFGRNLPTTLRATVLAVQGSIGVAFFLFILITSNPFTRLSPAPVEGRDLNPILQDIGLAIHPPLLYLGYVGFVVPFAFAVAALARGAAGAEWVVAVRRWTLFAWLSLTSGIMLGAYWAYYELGWGGYWAWDPVENASLLPWLTGTALLHSVMAQEKRNLFRGWNASLAIATFALSLLGTFLVRSGVLTSVHAFAVDPWRGMYLLGFLSIVTLGGFGLLIARVDTLRTAAKLDGTLSREAALLFNNLFLIVTAATVFVGTLYPLAVEVFTGIRLTVAAPYFNKVVLPILVAIVLLMSVGPVIPWRKASVREILKFLMVPGAVALALAAFGLAIGVRGLVPLLAVAGMGLVIATVSADVGRAVANRAAVSGKSYLSSLAWLALWNRRRYGGLVVHIGVVVVALGILASGLFQETKTVAVSPGDRIEISGYALTFKGLSSVEGPNWTARQADLDLHHGSEDLGTIHPQRRRYPRGEMVTTESSIRTTAAGDLYVVLGDELGEGRASIRASYFPLVAWIWAGWVIIIAGALFALSQGRQKARAAVAAGTREVVQAS